MIGKYGLQKVVSKDKVDFEYKRHFDDGKEVSIDSLNKLELFESLVLIWRLIGITGNKYIDNSKPWELAKTDKKKLEQVLSNLLYCISEIADLIAPFLPETSERIKEQIKTGKTDILFPRI